MRPTIYLAFVDDWELSGNGLGDIRELQFRPMRQLVDLYTAKGIRGSFNAEVMQQLSFRKHQEAHRELRELADEWDHNVRETFRQGHDIQLHIHPQWSEAEYDGCRWSLTGDWSILNYESETAYRMLCDGKEYLERLLRPLNPSYRCVSYRSGSWCIAPSPHMLQLLVKLGIVFDMSIVGGVRYETRNIKLDYSDCEEDFLPYYPVMTDARRVSSKPEPIVCVPTNHFFGSRLQVFKHHAEKVWSKVKQQFASAANPTSDVRSVEVYGQEWAQKSHESVTTRLYEKGVVPYIRGKHLISDLAQLDYSLLKEMLVSIRKRAGSSGLTDVPVILENHTKDVRDFSHIERFLNDVTSASDIKCLTLTELAENLQNGRFKIRTAESR